MVDNFIFSSKKRTAVVLFQLGGPDSLESIKPFLYNLFMDPDIINLPSIFLARKFFAKFVSSRRATKVAEKYKQIGGKSPIFDLTQQQAWSLESELNHQNIDASVFICMRYWHPMTGEVIQKIKTGNFEQVILLPLYPQYSKATTYSSLNEWNRLAKEHCFNIPTKLVYCYPNQHALIDAFVVNINKTMIKFADIDQHEIDLVFSAHGNYIDKGDPYQLQVKETVQCILNQGNWKSQHTLCYQSKIGPVKWLKPSLVETVERLAKKGRKHFLIIPVTFVTEHIETLYEINIETRKIAMAHGAHKFELMPALNNHPKFIQCLAELVQAQLATNL